MRPWLRNACHTTFGIERSVLERERFVDFWVGLGLTLGDAETQDVLGMYNTSYTTQVDTEARGNLIRNHKLFISSGHDEYWSAPMYDAAFAARTFVRAGMVRP